MREIDRTQLTNQKLVDNDVPDAARLQRLAQRMRPVGTIEIKVYNEFKAISGGEAKQLSLDFLVKMEFLCLRKFSREILRVMALRKIFPT